MPLEYPPQNTWPSAKVTLSIRFDEYGDVSGEDVAAIRALKPITQIKGSKDPRGNLKVIDDPNVGFGEKRFLLRSPTATQPKSGTPGGPSADTDNRTHDINGIIPRRAAWRQNGIRTADTLELEIKWADMPIDPRIIRSCSVQFYLGSLSPDQFARGVQGETRDQGDRGETQPINLIGDTFTDVHGNARSNLRFIGWVDKWEMTWSDGEPLIKLDCADNTRLLLKQPQPMKGAVSMTKPIDEAIAEYLAQFPQLEGMTVEYRPTELPRDKIPVLKKVLANTSHVPDLGPPSQGGGGGDDDSVWDYLDVIVKTVGHTIRVDGTAIIIQRARSLMNGKATPRSNDPYVTRSLPSGEYPIRTFVWGRNLSEMKISHEYTHRETKGIELRCMSTARKKTLVARYPEKADRPTHPLPGGKGDAHWQVVLTTGINDVDVLKRLAEDYYNNIFRNELRLDLKTKNLSSFGGGYLDPDILDMKPGDALQIIVDRGPDTIFGRTEEDLTDEQLMSRRLQGMGYGAKFSDAAANAYTAAGFQRVFLMKELGATWDVDDGVAIELVGINYIETRVDFPIPDDDTTVETGRK